MGEETWKVDHCLAALQDVPLQLAQPDPVAPAGPGAVRAVPPGRCRTRSRPATSTRPGRWPRSPRADPAAAAIGSAEAAEAHGLVILRHSINDTGDNYTRFVVLSPAAAPVDARIACKTSLILVTRHEEGALLRCLEILAGSGHSMTKLESRPRPGQPLGVPVLPRLRGQRRRAADRRGPGRAPAGRPVHQGARQLPGQGAAALGPPGQPRLTPPAEGSPAETLEAVAAARPAPAGRSRQYRLVDRAAAHRRHGDPGRRPPGRRRRLRGDGRPLLGGERGADPATAKFVRDQGAHVLRGGVFKPRTSPYSFQGLGWDGLDLLVAAGRETGLPVITEVMAVDQVQRMAKAADILQIGARNMQNFDLLREVGKAGPAGAAQARPVQHDRGVARGGRIHRGAGQSAGDPLRARHPDLRERHPQHPGPVRGRRRPRALAPADHRRPQPRHRATARTSRRWPGRRGRPAPMAC